MNKSTHAKMTLEEYQERLHGYKQSYLMCKDIRHTWKLTTPYTPDAEDSTWLHRALTCTRCKTTRVDYYRLHENSNRLERGYSTYRYPSGFSLRGLPEVNNLSEIMRFESYLRTMQTVNENHPEERLK